MRGAAQRVGVAIALQKIAARRGRQLRIDVEFRRQFRIGTLLGQTTIYTNRGLSQISRAPFLLRGRRPLGIRSAIADAAGFWTFCPNTQIAPRFDHERLILGALRFEISLSVAEVFCTIK
jgi:hypothetical protein